MKSGLYKVSFTMELNEEEVTEILEQLEEGFTDEEGDPVDVHLELVEEFDEEYHTEENELQELNFEELI